MSVTILTIETATVPFSVSIGDEQGNVFLVENTERTSLASQITIMIRECCQKANLKPAQLDAIAINEGPGSYTGLRIGMSVAKGLCFALNKPLILLSGLKAIANHVSGGIIHQRDEILICSALDARRDEVYLEIYDPVGKTILPTTACILPVFLEELSGRTTKKIVTAGDGGHKLISTLGEYEYAESGIMSRADYLLPLAFEKYHHKDFASIETSEPFYLKPPNITTPKVK